MYSYSYKLQHDNPKIQLVLNDGTQVYEHHSDGLRQEKANCLKEFRNKPYPVKLRIIYLRGVLEVRKGGRRKGGGGGGGVGGERERERERGGGREERRSREEERRKEKKGRSST